MADSTLNSSKLNESTSSKLNDSKSRLHLYNSSQNTTSMLSDNSNSSNKKRKTKSYQCILEYEDFKSAQERLNEPVGEHSYKFRYTKRGLIGQKDYYFCHGNQKCPKNLYILAHSDSVKASIWLVRGQHKHKEKKAAVLPLKSVAHIKKLFDEKLRLTNTEIIQSLKRNNCPQLTRSQINNLKQRLKHARVGKANCCLYELKSWCEKKRDIPLD